MAQEEIFVFVVCGTQEHIDTLHYSLEALKKFSKKKILILTDSGRNEISIIHDNIIDAATPSHFNNHQASVYLKTGIHKFLPKGNLYCYLDTDVVALDDKADNIFQQYYAPVTFAHDHCLMDRFSPAAIKCGCIEQFAEWEDELKYLFVKHKDLSRIPEHEEKKKILMHKFDEIKENKISYAWITFKFWAARNVFKLDEDTFYDKRNFIWHDRHGVPLVYEKDVEDAVTEIERNSPFRMNRENTRIWEVDGKNVFDCRCNHLQDQIKKTFGIEVTNPEWHHWNGGVFLFDDASHEFLESWHQKTLQIFQNPEWKIRDQGTLIATVWQFGLQNHKLLDVEFNLISDFNNLHMQHLGSLQFRFSEEGAVVKPHFVHVYHHWGDKKWDVWQAVEQRTGIYLEEESQTINSLWIGNKLSKLELLTIHSFLAKGHQFKLWTYDKLDNDLPEGLEIGDASAIIPREQVFSYKNKNSFGHGKGSYAGFSDIFRYKLLYENGGWWVDMDITCLKPFDFSKPYFFRPHHDMPVVGNVMKCPKGSKLMKRCYDEAIANVDEHNTDWHKPIEILNRHVKELDLLSYVEKSKSNFDMWDETSRFIWTDKEIPHKWYFIHWQNEEWRAKNVSKEDFFYQSALAKLLEQYGLYTMPHSDFEIWKNKVSHSELGRKIKSLFRL